MNKNNLITIMIILIIIVLSIIILNKTSPEISEEEAKCIGQNSKLYTQLGCSHCEEQEKLFGDNIKYINITDCYYEIEKCLDIEYTPTWIIKGKSYEGFQKRDKLKELTGC